MNSTQEHFSDEILNAYIDGELGPEDSARIASSMVTDDVLRRRVNDLQEISDLVLAAFEEEAPPARGASPRIDRSATVAVWRIAASIAVLSVTGLFVWHLYQHHTDAVQLNTQLAAAPAYEPPTRQSQVRQDMLRVMFHIGRNDPQLFAKVLDETDRLLSNHRDPNHPLTVRVVASHGGLSMFELDLAENAQLVRAIKSKYRDQVDFVGCGETYQQWKINTGRAPALAPEVLMVDSGVMELLRRQQQGWTFVSI